MYHGPRDPRRAQPALDTLTGFSPEATACAVLARIRKLLDAYVPGIPIERSRPADVLATPLSDPIGERERLFARGWLHWLHDEPAAAELPLIEAMTRAREQNAIEALAESAYWCARVRLLLGRGEALAEFESVLRTLGGSPRATVWFVDLLGRAGRVDRAEQVWKSVRGNRKVLGCVEGPLLEARMLLRRGEMTPAERVLDEAVPANGVVWVERLLLLAWIAASQKQPGKAREWLRQARQGPYPATALQVWTMGVEQRLDGGVEDDEEAERVPAALRDYLNGQRARREGRMEEASAAYRAALSSAVAQPFARYGLACLGQEDLGALLASQPGLFLALRCRARLAVERFRRREATPAEYLDALQQAAATGYHSATAEHFGRLAAALQQRQPDVADVRTLAANPATDAAGRNAIRAALELAVRRLPASEVGALLLEWSQRVDWPADLRVLIDQQRLRLSLLADNQSEAPARASLLTHQAGGDSPAGSLWQAAQRLDPQSTEAERWREDVRQLRGPGAWKGLAQALLLQEAAQRNDVESVLGLLDEVDVWRGLEAPPRFVLRALAASVAAQPHHPGWRRSLSRWLPLWDASALSGSGATLAVHAGLSVPRGDAAEPPAGVPALPWLLHQAARALGRADALEALVFLRRALVVDSELAGVAEAPAVREALPEIERQALAQALAAAVQPEESSTRMAAGVLVDAIAALAEVPEGTAVLDVLAAGDSTTARVRLEALSEKPDLPSRLAHHLALLMQRIAAAHEEQEDPAGAEESWRRAWMCWLRFFAAASADVRRVVLDFLLERHRHRINDLLARSAVDAARRYWGLVGELPARADKIEEELGRDLASRVERFREELATEYLLTTREAMRYGTIPEGWRADYEKGLSYLRRLLSLDRDNPRLLTALVEICDDWFLDLYHLSDPPGLRAQVERFTPFALQLARRINDRPGDLASRAALADFWKFRGFIAADRRQKIDLYREALRFNPANSNVRDLLADLEPPSESTERDADDRQSV